MGDPDLQIRRGAGHPDPEIRGGWAVSNFNFSALRASVWATNKGGPDPPGPLPWIRHCIVWRKLMLVTFGTITVTIQSVVKSLKTTDCPHTVGFKSWLVTGCKGKSVRLIFKIQNYREDFLDRLLR